MVNLVTGSRDNIVVLFSVLGGVMVVGAVVSIFVEEDLRRDKFEGGVVGEDGGRVSLVESEEGEKRNPNL